LLEQKESKIQERSYRPLQGQALLRRLSGHAPHLVMVNCMDIYIAYLLLNFIKVRFVKYWSAAGVNERCELQVLGK